MLYPKLNPGAATDCATAANAFSGRLSNLVGSPGQRGTVLEEVLIDHAGQRILFLGRETLQIDGGRLRASNFQPLFHVEHAAGGSVDDPLNLWRIVILTPEWDERYTEPFKEMAREGLLPGFLEIYIERKFHCDLKRRAA